MDLEDGGWEDLKGQRQVLKDGSGGTCGMCGVCAWLDLHRLWCNVREKRGGNLPVCHRCVFGMKTKLGPEVRKARVGT